MFALILFYKLLNVFILAPLLSQVIYVFQIHARGKTFTPYQTITTRPLYKVSLMKNISTFCSSTLILHNLVHFFPLLRITNVIEIWPSNIEKVCHWPCLSKWICNSCGTKEKVTKVITNYLLGPWIYVANFTALWQDQIEMFLLVEHFHQNWAWPGVPEISKLREAKTDTNQIYLKIHTASCVIRV